MKTFLLNNSLAIITLIATILIPMVVYILQKSKKELSYKIISENKIFNTEIDKRLKISFKDEVIKEDLTLILLQIKNTGNQPITKKEFEENSGINVMFGNDILSVEVKETKPSNLYINHKEVFPGYIEIQPLLLNPSDEFTLKLLVKNHTNDCQIDARISGISEVKPLKENLFSFRRILTYAIIISILSIISLINDFPSSVRATFFAAVLSGLIYETMRIIINPFIKLINEIRRYFE